MMGENNRIFKINLPKLAQELIVHSSRFEPFVPLVQPPSMEAHSALGNLEAVTRENLPKLPPKTTTTPETTTPQTPATRRDAQNPIPASASRPAPPAPMAAKAPPAVSTSKPEYRPALQDQSVVRALMDFHKQTRLHHPAPARKADQGHSQPQSQPQQSFSPTAPQQIQIDPKRATIHARANSRSIIIRPKTRFDANSDD